MLVFVDTQTKCDSLFSDLQRAGYATLSLHGGKDQTDRDQVRASLSLSLALSRFQRNTRRARRRRAERARRMLPPSSSRSPRAAQTIADFKKGDCTLMVATSVAGRGLDVPELCCVINYACPNHLEDYVHRVGRTGRAGRKGTAYTFISPKDEEQFAPLLVKALTQAKQTVPPELTALADKFKSKVAAGEARWAASGFKGKGFTFDGDEMTEEQKVADLQKKQTEVEMGLRDASDLLPEETRKALQAEADRKVRENDNDALTAQTGETASAALVVAPPPAAATAASGLRDGRRVARRRRRAGRRRRRGRGGAASPMDASLRARAAAARASLSAATAAASAPAVPAAAAGSAATVNAAAMPQPQDPIARAVAAAARRSRGRGRGAARASRRVRRDTDAGGRDADRARARPRGPLASHPARPRCP